MWPICLCIRHIRRGLYQGAHQINIIIIMLALQNSGDTFQPHARINRGARQIQTLGFGLLILHENKIPDFDKPVAIFIRRAWRAARDMLAMIIKNLGTGATGASITHRPEIIRSRNANDPIIAQSGNFPP